MKVVTSKDDYGKVLVYASLAIVGVFFFLLNQKMPLFADDYCRTAEGFDIALIASRTYSTYVHWSGRFPVMFLNFLFHSAGGALIVLLNVLNAVAFAVGSMLVLRLFPSIDRSAHHVTLVLFFIFLLWFVPDHFGEVALWKTGTVQYLWGMLIALYCIAPVLRYFLWDENVISEREKYVYLPVSFLGGAWLENVAVAVAVVWLACLGYRRIVKKHIPAIYVVALCLWLVGALLLIAAPGNYVRVEAVGEKMSIIQKILPLTVLIFDNIDKKLLAIAVGFIAVYGIWCPAKLKKRLLLSALFFSLAILSAYAMIGAPNIVFAGRIKFPTEFFEILAIVCLFPSPLFEQKDVTVRRGAYIAGVSLFATMVALLVIDASNVYARYADVWVQNERRAALVEASRDAGILDLKLPPLVYGGGMTTYRGDVSKGRLFGRDITVDPKLWPNACFAKAHNLRSVRL